MFCRAPEKAQTHLSRGLILTPEGISGRVPLVFPWVCPPSHKYLVEQGLGPAECQTTKLHVVYVFLLWLCGAGPAARHLPLPGAAFAGSAVLSFAFIRDLEGEAECFVLGRRKCFVQPKRTIFFFFFFFFHFIGKSWSNAISILPRPILGGRWGSGRLEWNAAFQLLLLLCAPLPGAVAHLCPVWCSAVPAASAAQCPLCPPRPSPPPRCAGDAPSGCGQRFLLL